jgi:hypothetical protein
MAMPSGTPMTMAMTVAASTRESVSIVGPHNPMLPISSRDGDGEDGKFPAHAPQRQQRDQRDADRRGQMVRSAFWMPP